MAAQAEQSGEMGQAQQDRGMVSHIGRLKIDWPRSIGYYGGIGAAVALGAVEPPLAIFIAAIPLMKLLNRPEASFPQRFIGQVLDGAAKPVGGSSDATIELESSGESSGEPASGKPASGKPSGKPAGQRANGWTGQPSIWQEARQIAGRGRAESTPS